MRHSGTAKRLFIMATALAGTSCGGQVARSGAEPSSQSGAQPSAQCGAEPSAQSAAQPSAHVVLGAPQSVAIGDDSNGPTFRNLVLDDKYVYWTGSETGWTVGKVAKIGGQRFSFSANLPFLPGPIAVDKEKVYWGYLDQYGNPVTPGLMSEPLGGGAPSMLPPNASPIVLCSGLVADCANLYFCATVGHQNSALYSIPKAGGPLNVVAPAGGSLAIDSNDLYYSTLDGIFKVPLAGGVPDKVSADVASNIAIDTANIYFMSIDYNQNVGVVGFVPIAGGPSTVLAAGRMAPEGFGMDEENLYWAEGTGVNAEGLGQQNLVMMPKTGGQVTVLVSGMATPSVLAVDASGVYFVLDHALTRLPRQ